MNGKDLMQALNDIDERYIEEALPWSAAVKKERHPVWALAAGLALCLGLGAGAALLFGGPLLSPMIGGLAMSFSSVSVISNALWLRRLKL